METPDRPPLPIGSWSPSWPRTGAAGPLAHSDAAWELTPHRARAAVRALDLDGPEARNLHGSRGSALAVGRPGSASRTLRLAVLSEEVVRRSATDAFLAQAVGELRFGDLANKCPG